MQVKDAGAYQGRITANISSDTCSFRCRFVQTVAINDSLGGKFRVVTVTTSVEETFAFDVLTGIENVVAFCARSEGCHCHERTETLTNAQILLLKQCPKQPYIYVLLQWRRSFSTPVMTEDEDHADEYKEILNLVQSHLVDSTPTTIQC